MPLLQPHVDRHLARLATSGALPPRLWTRVLRHARGCARCGPRYERVVHMRRVLAQDTLAEPTREELARISAHGLGTALAAATGGRAPARGGGGTEGVRAWVARRAEAWRARGAAPGVEGTFIPEGRTAPGPWEGLGRAWALAAVAACALLLLVQPEAEVEWAARGEGGTAVLRLFCVPEDSALREVKGEGACPAGASLAFAAGVRPPLTHAAVVVRGAEGTRVEGPFEVKGPPGAEAALDVTPRLPTSGEVEVMAVFASSAEAALAAARGESTEEVVRVQHRVRVEVAR